MFQIRKSTIYRILTSNLKIIGSVRRYSQHHDNSGIFPVGMTDEEPDVPVRELFDFKPLWAETKMYVQEWRDQLTNKHGMTVDAEHDDVKVQWKFDNEETISKWCVGSDSEFKRGFSKSELLFSKNKTAIFRGVVDTTIPKDGETPYSGMVGMRSEIKRQAFFRQSYHDDWAPFSHIFVKLRGDGRRYTIILHSPGFFDITWHDYYTYHLYTHGGPYWQYARIPFSKFYKAKYGKVQGGNLQVPLRSNFKETFSRQCPVVSMAIMLFDRIDGPFQLELDWIGVYHDSTHFEEFAYEHYDLVTRYN